MRYRFCGGRIVARVEESARAATLDARAKPFRKTDLSPREEMVELRAEIDQLERWDEMSLRESKREFPDLFPNKRIAELKKRLASLDYVFNDSAAPAPVTLAEINRRNAEFWKKGE